MRGTRSFIECHNSHQAGGMFPGIDVSIYQGQVDWPTAAKLGNVFAFIQAADGTTDNPYFPAQWDGAGAAGLMKSAYFFWRAGLSDDEQLAHWLSRLDHHALESFDGLAIDLEDESGATGDVTQRIVKIQNALATACRVMPVIYSSPAWIKAHLTPHSHLSVSGLWIADWNVPALEVPSGYWPFAAYWQDGTPSNVPCTGTPPSRDWFIGAITRMHLYGRAG